MKEIPIEFTNRVCKGPEDHLNFPSSKLTAVIFNLGKFRDYLSFVHFMLVTDNIAMSDLWSYQKLSVKLARWAILLSKI